MFPKGPVWTSPKLLYRVAFMLLGHSPDVSRMLEKLIFVLMFYKESKITFGDVLEYTWKNDAAPVDIDNYHNIK